MCFHHNVVALPKDPVSLEKKEISVPNEHIIFHVTPGFFYYGTVRSGEYRIVIGPSRQAAAQDQGPVRTIRRLRASDGEGE